MPISKSPLTSSMNFNELEAYANRLRGKREKRSNFSRGVAAGVDQAQALAFGAGAAIADAVGAEGVAENLIGGYQEQMRQASENAGDVMDVTAIQSLDDAGAWAAYTIGNAIPMLASVMLGGGVGGIAGRQVAKTAGRKAVEKAIAKKAQGFATAGMAAPQALQLAAKSVASGAVKKGAMIGAGGTSIGMSTGEIMGSVEEETGELAGVTSLAAGTVAGMADFVPIMRLFGSVGLDKEIVKQGILSHIKPIGKEVLKQAGLEAGTEAAQTLIEQAAVAFVKEQVGQNPEMFTVDQLKELVNAAAAGGLTGFALGVPGGIARQRGSVAAAADATRDSQVDKQLTEIEQGLAAGAGGEQNTTDSEEQQADPAADLDSIVSTRIDELNEQLSAAIVRGDQAGAMDAHAAINELLARRDRILDGRQQQSEDSDGDRETGVPTGDDANEPDAVQRSESTVQAETDELSVDGSEEASADARAQAESIRESETDPDQIRGELKALRQKVDAGDADNTDRSRIKQLSEALIAAERVDGDIMAGNGRPWKNANTARKQLAKRKLEQSHSVQPMADGFVLRPNSADAPSVKLEQAANEAATSPANDLPEPTDAEKEAGNYKLGHVTAHGLNISIENPKGSIRKGDGWQQEMAHDYGYFRRSEAVDGDHVDVFINRDGFDDPGQSVFIVDQVDQDGQYDEPKVMMGFADEASARQGYLDNYEDGWTGLGAITEMPLDQFKAWLADPAQTKRPVSQALQEKATTGQKQPETDADTGARLKTLNDEIASVFGSQYKNAYQATEPPKKAKKLSAAIADVFDQDIQFVRIKPDLDGQQRFNGVHMPDNGTIYIDRDSTVVFANVLGHEIMHALRVRRPDLYNWLARKAMRSTASNLKGFQDYHRAMGADLDRDLAREELLADALGDAFTDPAFLQELAEDNPGKFRALVDTVVDYINGLIDKIKGNPRADAYRQYVTDMEALRDDLQTALQAYANDTTGPEAQAQRQARRTGQAQFQRRVAKLDPETADGRSLSGAYAIAESTRWPNGTTFRTALNERIRAILADKPDATTDEALIEIGVENAREAMLDNSNAIGWYEDKISEMFAILERVHPELASDGDSYNPNRFAFTFALAVTSNGQRVDNNLKLAERAYRAWRETGRMPTTIGAGPTANEINRTMRLFNDHAQAVGLRAFHDFLATPFTVGELKQRGHTIGDELVTTQTHGSVILGPKIGGGFYQNLIGNYSPITIDRWMTTTWGRWTGTLIDINRELLTRNRATLRGVLEKLTPAARRELGGILNHSVAKRAPLDSLSRAIRKAAQRTEKRQAIEAIQGGIALRKAGNALAKNVDGAKLAPKNGTERARIRSVMSGVLQRLQADHPDITMADLQALLWYPEKRLFDTATNKQGDVVKSYDEADAPDYANAAAQVAAAHGITDEEISNVRSGRSRQGDQRNRGARNTRQPQGRQATQADGSVRSEPAFQRRDPTVNWRNERRPTIKRFRQRLGAGRDRPAYDGKARLYTRGGRRAAAGLGVTATPYRFTSVARKTLGSVNESTPLYFELDPGRASASLFERSIQAAKANNTHGSSVHVYPVGDYDDMRLFLSETGKSGFAIKPDGDLVSVFSDPSQDGDGRVGVAMVLLATDLGATKLDAFDTVLPDLYSLMGFRETDRLTWEDQYAPDDWDKSLYSQYNNGEPDVVFMEYDPDYFGDYQSPNSPRFQRRAMPKALDAYGMYSPAYEAAINLKQQKGKPEHLINALKSVPGVKAEELEWSGVDAWIEANAGQTVTREQLAEWFSGHAIEIEETIADIPYVDEEKAYPDLSLSDFDEEILDEPEHYEHISEDLMDRFENDDFDEGFAWDSSINEDMLINQYGRDPLDDDELNSEWQNLLDTAYVSHILDFLEEHIDEDYRDTFKAQVEDDYRVWADERAREIYMESPERMFRYSDDYGNVFEIIGSDDAGYSLTENGEYTGEDFNEPYDGVDDVSRRVFEYEVSHVGEYTTDENDPQAARWEEYVTPGPYEGYHEVKLIFNGENEEVFENTTHFPDENVLLFTRNTTRALQGDETFFLEEMQSDWHTEGRKVGYDDLTYAERNRLQGELNDASQAAGYLENLRTLRGRAMDIAKERDQPFGEAANPYNLMVIVNTVAHDPFGTKKRPTGIGITEAGAVQSQIDATPETKRPPLAQLLVYLRAHAGAEPEILEAIGAVESFQREHGEKIRTLSMGEAGVPNAPYKRDAWIDLGIRRMLIRAVNEGADRFAWPDANVLTQRWSEQYRKMYEILYDTKLPKAVKKAVGVKAEHTVAANALNGAGYWSIPITDEVRAKVQEGLPKFQRRGPDNQATAFRSIAYEQAQRLKQKRGKAEQLVAMLLKTPGVKAEELKWADTDAFIEAAGDRTVTREELAEHIKTRGVRLTETVTTEPTFDNLLETDPERIPISPIQPIDLLRLHVDNIVEQLRERTPVDLPVPISELITMREVRSSLRRRITTLNRDIRTESDDRGLQERLALFDEIWNYTDQPGVTAEQALERFAGANGQSAQEYIGTMMRIEPGLPGHIHDTLMGYYTINQDALEQLLQIPAHEYRPVIVETRNQYTIAGSDALGYRVLVDGSVGSQRSESLNEALIRLRATLLEDGDTGPVSDEDAATRARWEGFVSDGPYENYREIKVKAPDVAGGNAFESRAHFPGEQNIVLFLRVSDRMMNGQTGLYIEELQSDWHQKGRRVGFTEPSTIAENEAKLETLQNHMARLDRMVSSDERQSHMAVFDALDTAYLSLDIDDPRSINLAFLHEETTVAHKLRTFATFDEMEQAELLALALNTAPRWEHDMVLSAMTTIGPEAERMQKIGDLEGRISKARYLIKNGIPLAPLKGDAWIEAGLRRAAAHAITNGQTRLAWIDSAGMQDRWSDAYAELYTNLYDRKLPKFAKKLFKGAPKHDGPNGRWVIDIPDNYAEEVSLHGTAKFQTRDPETPARRRGARNTQLARPAEDPYGRNAGNHLEGLPETVDVDGQEIRFTGLKSAEQAAIDYMRKAGLPYTPIRHYLPVDIARAERIAGAFDAMEHAPQDPTVKASYRAMIDETYAQYQAMIDAGVVVEFNPPGEDPYGNPRNAILDVVRNNHMFVFPTDEGFGSDVEFDPNDNPLLEVSPFKYGSKPALANDIFRAVHDYFGHIKNGVGFRARGEENAWRSHASMYSPLARPAATTETRGQNSWLNFGPYGETNRTAKVEDTHFADQKIGLLPDWALEDDEIDYTGTPRYKFQRRAGDEENTSAWAEDKVPKRVLDVDNEDQWGVDRNALINEIWGSRHEHRTAADKLFSRFKGRTIAGLGKDVTTSAGRAFDHATRGWRTRRQLVEVMAPLIPRAYRYLRLAEQLDADRRALQAESAEVGNKWVKLSAEERDDLAAVMHMSTIGQVDPSQDYKPLITEAEYKERKKQLDSVVAGMVAARGKRGTAPLNEEKAWLDRVWAQEQNRRKNRDPVQNAYDSLTPRAKRTYREAQASLKAHRDATLEAIQERIKDSIVNAKERREAWERIRQQFETQELQGPYFPLSRFGQFWVSTGEGENRSVDMFETIGEWEKFIDDMKRAGETVTYGKSLEDLMEAEVVPTGFMRDIHELLGGHELSREENPKQWELRDQIHQLYLASLPELSVRHHNQHRKNVRGFNPDALRAFSRHSFHSAHQIAKLRYMHKLSDTLADMRDDVQNSHRIAKVLRRQELMQDLLDNFTDETSEEIYKASELPRLDKEERKRLKSLAGLRAEYETNADIQDEINRLQLAIDTAEKLDTPRKRAQAADWVSELAASHQRLAKPDVTRLSTQLNSLGFVWYLGLSPAAALVNLTQIPMTHLPHLGARYGHKAAVSAINQAYADFFKPGRNGKRTFTVSDRLEGEELQAYNELVRRGVIDVTLAMDLAGLAEDGVGHDTMQYRIMKGVSWAFHNAERMNREIAALSAYRLAKDAGKSHEAALQEASDMTWKTQYDYGSSNRARFMAGSWMRVITQFKQYSLATTFLYLDAFRAAMKGATPEAKAEARAVLKSMFAIQFAMTGLLGGFGFRALGSLTQVLANLLGDDDEDFDYDARLQQGLMNLAQSVTGNERVARAMSQALSKGMFDAFTPISLHGRLSISELWFRSPDQDIEGRDMYYHLTEQLLGPMGGLVQKALVGSSLVMDGKVERGLEYMVPKAIGDVMKSGRMAMEDARTMSGNLILDLRADEAVIKLLGFQPSRLAAQYDQNSAKRRLQTHVQRRRSELMRDMVDAINEDDRPDMRKAKTAIDRFNARYPTYTITERSIKQSKSSRDRANERTVQGFRANRRLDELLDDYTFGG